MFVINLVTLKAAAKRELLFNPTPLPEAGLSNKSSHLAAALGVTKFLVLLAMNLVTLCCATSVSLGCLTNHTLRPIC
jgi:hypothetical protein